MDDLGRFLAQSVLHKINEIEKESNLDYFIDHAAGEISQEAKLIKEKINSIKAVLGNIV